MKDKLVEIFNKPNECHFAHDHQKGVCSPDHVVAEIKNYIVKKGARVNTNDPVAVITKAKELLNCKSESCILLKDDFQQHANISDLEQILTRFFKPEGPALNFGLLSNFNIDDVLDQFEKRFESRKFLHIPFQMRDFEKIGSELAKIDLAAKFKTYKTFGVVLNTDWSSGSGIHWFCLFGEHYGDKIVLEYFNSSGKGPLPEVQAWLHKTKHYLTRVLKIPVHIHYNTGIRFQDDEHSCGVYSLAYIWMRLEGFAPDWFRGDNFNDALMHRLRKNLFRWEQ